MSMSSRKKFSFDTVPTSSFKTAAPTGTSIKFDPAISTDTDDIWGIETGVVITYQCITCMKEYENKSLEELRFEDYVANRKGFVACETGRIGGFRTIAQPTGGLCGYSPAASTSGFSLGNTIQNKLMFGTTGNKNIDTLCENFKDLLLDGQDHNLKIKVKDKEFRAHKDVLRVRSPVLQSMLNLDMAEKNSGVVKIEDCDPAAFEQFLFYLYSGKVETLDESNMLGLYYIADKYDMPALKEDCYTFIKESLSSRLVCDVIQLALKHSDTELLNFAKNYFMNNVDEILYTVEWMVFLKENPIQANELFIKAWGKTKK